MDSSYKAKCKHKNSSLSKIRGTKRNLRFNARIRLAEMEQWLGWRPCVFRFVPKDRKDTISS